MAGGVAWHFVPVKDMTRDTHTLVLLLQEKFRFLPYLSERKKLSCAYQIIEICHLRSR